MKRSVGNAVVRRVAVELLEQRWLMARPTGIDVSHWQGTINWPAVTTNSPQIEFAWTKASEGTDYIDPTWGTNANNAAAAGIPIMGYHFARYDTNPDATLEAQHYLDAVGPYLTAGRMPPMLDVEHAETLTKAELSAWVNTWCNYVLNATGLRPVIYTGISFSNSNLDTSVTQWPLWIANWNGANPQTGQPSSTGVWPTPPGWNFWQYTSTGSVTGVSGSVDMDVFNGTSAQLDTWLIPQAAGSPSPANGATGVNPGGLVLNWADSAHAMSYDVYVDNVLRANVTTSQWTVSPQLAQGSHTWKVLAKNNAGAVTGPTWSFSASVGPPAAPASPTPANNAMLTVQPTKLDWADSLGAENYDVYIGTNPTPFRVTASEITVAPADGVRLWRVVANNANGSTSGAQWQYTLDRTAPTALYGGQQPAGGATLLDFTVTYSDATTGVDVSSIGSGDITVTGPNGYSASATLMSVDSMTNGTPRVATYRIGAPGGSWNLADSGTYVFSLNSSQIKDVMGNWTAAQTVQNLAVNVPFAYKVGLQLRVEFDGTATPVTVGNGGSGVISASRLGQTLNFTSVASIMVQGTSAADTLGWAGPISQGVTFNGSGGNDTIDVTGGMYTFSTDAKNMSPAGSVAITVGSGGTAMFNATQHLRSLTVLDGGSAVLGASGSRVLRTAGLSVAPTGTVDLKDNDLIVDGGSYTDVRAKVLAGFGGGLGGITSTSSDGSQILALFDNALIGSTDWNGETIGANAIVGKYTYFGDVNLDGQVTGDDYTIIDSNLNTAPAVGLEWLSGDANLDGIVTGDDYTTIDSNLGVGAGNPLSPAAFSVVEIGNPPRKDLWSE